MLSDCRRAVEDLDDLLSNQNLHVVAHKPMRHAVTHGVDLDVRIGGHTAPQPALARGKRSSR
jgi:hypothetical protein